MEGQAIVSTRADLQAESGLLKGVSEGKGQPKDVEQETQGHTGPARGGPVWPLTPMVWSHQIKPWLWACLLGLSRIPSLSTPCALETGRAAGRRTPCSPYPQGWGERTGHVKVEAPHLQPGRGRGDSGATQLSRSPFPSRRAGCGWVGARSPSTDRAVRSISTSGGGRMVKQGWGRHRLSNLPDPTLPSSGTYSEESTGTAGGLPRIWGGGLSLKA